MTWRPEAYKIMDFSELMRPHNPENTLGSPLVVEGSGGTDLVRGEVGGMHELDASTDAMVATEKMKNGFTVSQWDYRL